jgi:orotidine-5'-phosphate decarboxylase
VRAGPAGRARAVERFCLSLLAAVGDAVVAVKPQLAFFEALGHAGLATLERVCEAARAAGLLVVVDGKRGDIDSTARAYADAYLRSHPPEPPLGDALTVNPLLGRDALAPFLEACREEGAGLFVLVRTSNPGSADLQGLELADGGQVWERVARLVAEAGETLDAPEPLSSVGAVVGATQPGLLGRARVLMPRTPFLLPGVGAQGGIVETLRPAWSIGPAGGLVTASRSLMHPKREPGETFEAASARAAEALRGLAWRLVEEAA